MLLNLIDRASRFAALASRVLFIILIVSMLYEVISRYLFNASTIWAFDISYMATGAAFVLGIGWTLKVDGHVKIDIIVQLLPERVRKFILGFSYIFMLLPVVAVIAWNGWERTISAYITGAVETVSTWAPLMWPFYLAIAVGLSTFSLQLLAEGIRNFTEKPNKLD